ncbi:MAG: asparagine synthetase [Flavipsychrobacter sp.]|jgi:hypothetical protein|nr:asparagine synthetase [Flavipsychrobacter sp.]
MKKTNLLKGFFVALGMLLAAPAAFAAKILIPMDADNQANHLKAYGITYAALQLGMEADWLLNYQGGSFAIAQTDAIERLCKLRGVSYQVMSDGQYLGIVNTISHPDYNGDIIKLEKPPRIAVYTPPGKQPWDDAVTLVLTYAEIPFDKLYDEEMLADKLSDYDWLHLHHEDFTGQYGKFWAAYRNAQWYQDDVKNNETIAAKHGFRKVSQLKLAVAKKIRDFVLGGGYLFAMCSATDSYDIGLAAEGTDIADVPYDGDPPAGNVQQMLDFTKGFAFKNYEVYTNPYMYEFSSIDNTDARHVQMDVDYFTLFTFSAKFDPVPTMLCQNHTTTIKGFMGQTTSFKKQHLKTNVLVMGEYKPADEARYIHGEYGKGTWTFYGGHDPEDYQHAIGDPPTELSSHPTSPGYRLILNNVLFPAAKKKPRKT